MIAYLDSSVLVRSYLPDEDGHDRVSRLLDDPDVAAVTSRLTWIEVSGALVRAAAARRGDRDRLLRALDVDLGDGGKVVVIGAEQREIEDTALGLVRAHALRALDAWHLAVAKLAVLPLAGRGEAVGFASRDRTQAEVAQQLGFVLV